jgi:hypothetical protein
MQHRGTQSGDATGSICITGTPNAALKTVVTDIIISCNTNNVVHMHEETGGTIALGPWYIASAVPFQITTRSKLWKAGTASYALWLTAGSAGSVNVETWAYGEA